MGGENVRIELPTVLPAFSAVDVFDCARVELLLPKLNTISIFTTDHIKEHRRHQQIYHGDSGKLYRDLEQWYSRSS
jgi:hypothetical protein